MNTRPNPYVGPRAFQPGEPFYGRDRELRLLAALLMSSPPFVSMRKSLKALAR